MQITDGEILGGRGNGDGNYVYGLAKYFYNLCKSHQSRNSIWSSKNLDGNYVYGDEVFNVAVTYFEALLGPQVEHHDILTVEVRCPMSYNAYNLLNALVSHAEIEKVILSADILNALVSK